MRLPRRQFLAAGAALGAAGLAPLRGAFAAVGAEELRARPAKVQLAPPEYGPTEIWGYDGRASTICRRRARYIGTGSACPTRWTGCPG